MRRLKLKNKSILLFIILFLICFLAGCASNEYSDILIKNWRIELSGSWIETYEYQSDLSPLGDGEHYHIYECESFEQAVINVSWIKEKNDNIEIISDSILDNLSINNEFKFYFKSEYEYYYNRKEDDSSLIIIHVLGSNLIYVLENIM